MFKSLRTSTKLLLLCSVFIGALAVATYSLVAEKQIAINFVRKELQGVAHLEALRDLYVAILTKGEDAPAAAKEAMSRLVQRGVAATDVQDTADLQNALASLIDEFALYTDAGISRARSIDALIAAQRLASRIGDDSNLTLDPDLDSYYVQDIVVTQVPTLLTQFGELHLAPETPSSVTSSPDSEAVRTLVLDGRIRSTLDSIERDLHASYRGNGGEQLRAALDDSVERMASASRSYLNAVKGELKGTTDTGSLNQSFDSAVGSAIDTWAASLDQLEQLLDARLSNLLSKRGSSLLLNGLLAALSVAFAVVTGRHIVRPLLELERLADAVGQTQNYKLRADYDSRDEIGRLAAAFNAMLAELAAAREREATDSKRKAIMQAELGRVSRITTMGEIAASIAHEINQPLAAIVNNANASLRWLGRDPPNVSRARSVLERVVSDGARASEVIGSVRSMLAKSRQERDDLDVNDLICEVITFIRSDLRQHGISLRLELADDLPKISAVRIQLQQVLLNLVANAVESMADVEHHARVLTVRSQKTDGHGILISVEDSGAGIAQKDAESIFEAFFSTKPEGMGMGLSICRSIVEAHGGRISASPAATGGSIFQVSLPSDEADQSP